MVFNQVDQRILGYLGRALSLEMSAVQQYSTQAQLLGVWGLPEASKQLRIEANEEIEHAERIISRMLALGVAPNASQLRAVSLGSSLIEILQRNYEFEHELVHFYDDAVQYCVRKADYDNKIFFETLLNEEKTHAIDLANWIERLESLNKAEETNRATF